MNQFTGQLISQHKRVGIVVAQFNELVTSRLLEGCVSQLALLGIADAAITVVHVPGAMEIPREVKLLGDTGQVDGIIALGGNHRLGGPHVKRPGSGYVWGADDRQHRAGTCPCGGQGRQ